MGSDGRLYKIIRGAGGGGGKGGAKSASIAADSLASRSYAKVGIAICEGEVDGIVGGLQGVFLDGTPLQNLDNSFNFQGISFDFNPGTQTQSWIPGFSDVENEVTVGTQVFYGTPLVQTISDPNANAVRVTINVPQMQYQNTSNGDVSGSSFGVAIDVQTNGGGFVQQVNDTVSGKCSSNYERDYLINLAGTGPWDIRVRRTTANSTASNIVNAFYWTSYTEIINAKLTYPNTALGFIMVDASQFQSIPTVAFHMRLLQIKIPSNYNPATRVYTGAWDGTFIVAWSNNPAWCFYDLLTNPRYGLGNYIAASQVDKWALYTIGQYCDQLVPDGMGGMEPRFCCNAYIQNYADAFQVLQDLASCFRGMPFWATGSVTANQDAPGNPAAIFTAANVINGDFTYTGAALSTRHTVALVTWFNMNDQAKPYVEYVSNDTQVAIYGEIITQVTAFGCTSRGQAQRVGKWILYTEQYEGETVAFSTGLDGSPVRPGQIIKIADPVRGGQRLGGRINTATAGSVTTDAAIVDASGNPVNVVGATITVMALDGSVQTSTVQGQTTAAGGQSVLTLVTALAVVPQAQALWVIELPTVKAQLFRVIQVTQSDRETYDIVATAYNPSKYSYIDNGTVLVQQNVTNLTLPVAAPASVSVTESLYSYQSTIFSMAAVSWPSVPNAISYIVGWSKDNGPLQYGTTPNNEFDLSKTNPGVYTFYVWSVDASQNKSATYATVTQTLYGNTLPPSNITGLTYGFDPANGLVLNWAAAPDINLATYEVRMGVSWAAGTLVGQSKSTTMVVGTMVGTASIVGKTFWVAVLDTQGVYSATPMSVSPVFTAIPAPTVTAALSGVNAVITWNAVTGSVNIDHYEVRTDTNWGNATNLICTLKGTGTSSKVNWSGTQVFYVRAVDICGNTSAAGNASVTVNAPSAPAITQQVIDNNVLLKWTASTGTLPVDHYIVAKGATFATATVIGNINATFDIIFETQAGTYTYWVVGVDAAGNQGTPASVSAYVNPPPDYVLQYNFNSTFAGTKTNIATDQNGALVMPVDTATTFQAHFTNNSWAGPSAQVSAGYPLFIEPALLTATYVESIDYGAVLSASNIIVTPTTAVISGSPVLACSISVSPDNSTWTTYSNTTNVFVSNFRYVKVTLTVTGTTGLDLLDLISLNIKYQVKQKTDSGSVTCNAGDSGGTVVNFATTFLSVTSLVANPVGSTAAYAVVNFAFPANPTSFQILLYNSSGTRISGTAAWTARGV